MGRRRLTLGLVGAVAVRRGRVAAGCRVVRPPQEGVEVITGSELICKGLTSTVSSRFVRLQTPSLSRIDADAERQTEQRSRFDG